MPLVIAPRPEMGLLDTADAAKVLGVHPKTLVRWVRAGKVQAMRTPGARYRFRRSDLEDFVASSMASALSVESQEATQ